MATKQLNTRVALKHDIETNWITAGNNGFCPLAGEVIIYDIDENCSRLRYKIGQWTNASKTATVNINDLPFESNVYVGADEPLNAPVGFIWVDTSDTTLTYAEEVQF